MLDEHGMPVPHAGSPLPWKPWPRLSPSGIIDANGRWIENSTETIRFQVHTANFYERTAEIVRRLGKPQALSLAEVEAIMLDAANLWSEMQEDAKGGGDETGV